MGDLLPIDGVCFMCFALRSDYSDTYRIEGDAILIGECLGEVEPLLIPLKPLREVVVSSDPVFVLSIGGSCFLWTEFICSLYLEYLSALICVVFVNFSSSPLTFYCSASKLWWISLKFESLKVLVEGTYSFEVVRGVSCAVNLLSLNGAEAFTSLRIS